MQDEVKYYFEYVGKDGLQHYSVNTYNRVTGNITVFHDIVEWPTKSKDN